MHSTTKTALITGASRGIGAAIAEAFAAAGYNLFLTCRQSEEQLNRLAKRLISDYRITCETFVGDMGNYQTVCRLFDSMVHPDVLINNAGISYIGLLTDMTPEAWHTVMNTNLNAAFYLSKCALPCMIRRQAGKIINISSVWGNVGASMEVAYSASKGGLNAFTKALAKELAPSNIQVNAIACGVIDTDMNRCFSKETIAALTEEIPADRMGTPEEVARLALLLADAPSYLTGQIITLDGGWC